MESKTNDTENKIKQSDLEFPKDNEIGHGAFGKVLLAIVKGTGEKVAIKKVFQDRRYKNRELPIMLELHHPNIVELKSYFCTKAEKASEDEFFLNCIMEYVPLTLSHLISQNRKNHTKFDNILLKLFSYQMLKCIGYLHSLGICHRDIKPQNILIDPADYTLKLCDFGCAKHLVKTESNIAYICSRFYRPPELVLGATKYSTKVDVWSMGCVIAELVLNKPIFPGKSATDQLMEIMKVLGTPTKEQMKSMNGKNIKISKLPVINQKSWKDVFKGKNDDEVFMDLVGNLLVYEPQKRLGPYQALCHPYFNELKQKDVILPDNKKLPKHLFEFKECEINFDKESIQKLLSQIQK
jgi:glycogen synthase kinase 3 beta